MPRYIQPIAHKIDAVSRTKDVFTEERVDFSALHLSPAVLSGLRNSGFERPSPIQLKAIPIGRIGLDVIAQAKAGTGKTCVFGVIVLEAMNIKVHKCQCIVVAPTREIAAQIQTVMSVLACDIQQLRCVLVIGGTSVQDDKEAVGGAHIVIGTPGRLLHLIEDGILDTECVRTLVLDEADKLVDDSFYTPVKSLASQLPKSKQVLAMSATYHKDIDSKFNTLMRDPYYVRLSADNLGLEGIQHFYYTVKSDKVKHQIFCNKISRLVEVLSNVTFEQCLVFSNYPAGAEEISVELKKMGFSNEVIAGNMAQKSRSQAMADFRECRFRVLISTDVTARGIDNEHVDLVVNMDLPLNSLSNPDPHTYLHRAGRAGRFGKYGSAISIVASQKEHMFIQDLQDKYQVEVRVGPPYHQITELLRRSKVPIEETESRTDTQTEPRIDTQPQSRTDTQLQLETEPLVENSWKGSLSEDRITVLRSNVKVTQKPKPDTAMVNGGSAAVLPNHISEEREDHGKEIRVQENGKEIRVQENGKKSRVQENGARENGVLELDGKLDGDAALSSLGSLGKVPSESCETAGLASEDDTAVFTFNSRDLNTYQPASQLEDMMLHEALGSLDIGPDDDQISSSNPSTCGSQKPSDTDANEVSRSRRGSKKEKKARKPPKTLTMTSPKQGSGRRAMSAAPDLANTTILSPHTPKWRSEAVSTTGCIIHSKAINVKFHLENYLFIRYDFTDKRYDNDHRGYFPTKPQILQNSSTALCETPLQAEEDETPDKIPISRFVSHGFVANSEHDPLAGKSTPPRGTPPRRNTPPAPEHTKHASLPEDELTFTRKSSHDENPFDDNPACSSFNSARMNCPSSSSFGSARQPCAHHRPTDIPHLCREQSKDSGICTYPSPYQYPPYHPYSGTPNPPYYPGYWNMWPPYMPPMCGYPPHPMPPPPQPYCANCVSPPQFNSSDCIRNYNSAPEYTRHTLSSFSDQGPRHHNSFSDQTARPPPNMNFNEQNMNSWSNAWDKAWGQ